LRLRLGPPQQRVVVLARGFRPCLLRAADRRGDVAARRERHLEVPLRLRRLADRSRPPAQRAQLLRAPLRQGRHPALLDLVPLDLGPRGDEAPGVVVLVDGGGLPALEPLVGDPQTLRRLDLRAHDGVVQAADQKGLVAFRFSSRIARSRAEYWPSSISLVASAQSSAVTSVRSSPVPRWRTSTTDLPSTSARKVSTLPLSGLSGVSPSRGGQASWASAHTFFGRASSVRSSTVSAAAALACSSAFLASRTAFEASRSPLAFLASVSSFSAAVTCSPAARSS